MPQFCLSDLWALSFGLAGALIFLPSALRRWKKRSTQPVTMTGVFPSWKNALRTTYKCSPSHSGISQTCGVARASSRAIAKA